MNPFISPDVKDTSPHVWKGEVPGPHLGYFINSEEDDGVGGSGAEDGIVEEIDVVHVHNIDLLNFSVGGNGINSESLTLSIESVALFGNQTIETLNGKVDIIAVLQL